VTPISFAYRLTARSTRPARVRPSALATRSIHVLYASLPRTWTTIGLRSGSGGGAAFFLAMSGSAIGVIRSPSPPGGAWGDYPTPGMHPERWGLGRLMTFYTQ